MLGTIRNFRFHKLYFHCDMFCRMFRQGAEWAEPGPLCSERQTECALSGGMRVGVPTIEILHVSCV